MCATLRGARALSRAEGSRRPLEDSGEAIGPSNSLFDLRSTLAIWRALPESHQGHERASGREFESIYRSGRTRP
jgi:hypothetical protein